MRTRPSDFSVSTRVLIAQPRKHIDTVLNNRRKRGQRGIYAWFADSEAQDVLRRAKLRVRRDGLVYIGITTTSFRERTSHHVHNWRSGNLCVTLHWAIGVAGAKRYGGDVREFMRTHFTVAVIAKQVRRRRRCEQQLRDEEHQLILAAEDAEPGLLNRRPSTSNGKRIDRACERGEMGGLAVAKPEPAPGPDTARLELRKLSRPGRFRRDFWAHVALRHPDEAPPGWAGSNVYHRVDAAGRRISQYVARGGVGLFFPREPGESAEARTVAVAPIVRRLRAEIKDPRMTDSGWSFRELNSRDRRNWDRMADWLHERRLQYERALRDAGSAGTSW